eukprot:5967598-Amphidinium_carterae.1
MLVLVFGGCLPDRLRLNHRLHLMLEQGRTGTGLSSMPGLAMTPFSAVSESLSAIVYPDTTLKYLAKSRT